MPVGKPRRRPESASLCRVVVLVTEAEREDLRARAKAADVSVGEYVRQRALSIEEPVTVKRASRKAT